MSNGGRFILATLSGLVLAGIVHLAAILAVPWLADRDALSRLRHTATANEAELIASPGASETWLPHPDPAIALAACAYDLGEGPLRITAHTTGLFQSLSFHARAGGIYYALTDRAAIRGALDLVVLTRRQYDEILAREDEEEPSRDVRIVAPHREGFVIVRVLASFPSERELAEAVAKSVRCTVDPMPGES